MVQESIWMSLTASVGHFSCCVCAYMCDVSCSPTPYSSSIMNTQLSLVVTSFNICKVLRTSSENWHYRAFLCGYNCIICIHVFLICHTFSVFVNLFRCNCLEHCIKAPVSSPANSGGTSDWSFGWRGDWVILPACAYDQHHGSQPICTSSFREIKGMEELCSGKGKKKRHFFKS